MGAVARVSVGDGHGGAWRTSCAAAGIPSCTHKKARAARCTTLACVPTKHHVSFIPNSAEHLWYGDLRPPVKVCIGVNNLGLLTQTPTPFCLRLHQRFEIAK